jgi:hypothetical protein
MSHAILHAMGVVAASNTYMRIFERDNNHVFMNQDHNSQKGEKMLHEVQFKQVLYDLACQYYTKKNVQWFVTPTIILTSISSFLSFAATANPEISAKLSLIVGFMGTVATILTALRSQYAFDTRAEMFRSTAAEYHLVSLKLKSKLRKEAVTAEAWATTWQDIDLRMAETQKKLTIFPPTELVNKWRRLGKFTPTSDVRGSLMPPWSYKYKNLLVADGIQSAEDIEYVEDDMFMYWEETGRYPAVVVAKLKDLRDQAKEVRANPGLAFGAPTSRGVQLPMVDLKPSTQEAFRKRGVDETSKLKYADDRVLNAVVEELITRETPPYADHWEKLEIYTAIMRKWGILSSLMQKMYKGGCYKVRLSQAAEGRLSSVHDADDIIVQGVRRSRSSLHRMVREDAIQDNILWMEYLISFSPYNKQ